jgi:hypothetical protein
MKRWISLLAIAAMAHAAQADDDANWVRVKLDERFRSEGVAAADINASGSVDAVDLAALLGNCGVCAP